MCMLISPPVDQSALLRQCCPIVSAIVVARLPAIAVSVPSSKPNDLDFTTMPMTTTRVSALTPSHLHTFTGNEMTKVDFAGAAMGAAATQQTDGNPGNPRDSSVQRAHGAGDACGVKTILYLPCTRGIYVAKK